MEKGQIVELTIEDMSAEGRGIGKIYDDERGFAVFVQDTVVGDRAKVELTKVKKNYAFGRVSEMLALSQDRQESFCPHSGLCGGCVYSQLSYEAQLALKEKQVREKLVRLGGLTDPVIMPIIGMGGEDVNEVPFRYRNKASMPVSTGGLITQKGGIVKPVHEPRVGFYRPKSHDVVDCEDCLLQSEPAMAAAAALRKFMEEDHITSYDPRWEKGLMRHMIVRTAAGTGEVMVILVINGKAIPNAPKLIEMLDEAIYNVPVYEDGPLAGVEFNLESVIVNINKSKNLEGQILGEECITIAGKPTITEEVGGLSFEISPLSFYQVNREQMVRLYEKALEYASLKGDETVLDLYCGVGTIGLFAAAEMNRRTAELNAAAAAGQAVENAASGQNAAALNGTTASGQAAADKSPGRVIGIESVKGAVLDANRNATINGIVNARYVCGKAEEELPKDSEYDGFPQIENGVGLCTSMKWEYGMALEDCEDTAGHTEKSIATGVLAYDFICGLVNRLGSDKIRVYSIKNNFFGEHITVSGLVTGGDIIAQLKDKPIGEMLLIPTAMLRHDEDIFLDNVTVAEVENALGVKIVKVQNDGFEFLEALLK